MLCSGPPSWEHRGLAFLIRERKVLPERGWVLARPPEPEAEMRRLQSDLGALCGTDAWACRCGTWGGDFGEQPD